MIAILPCGRHKLAPDQFPALAKDVYIGPLAGNLIRLFEGGIGIKGSYLILSAQWGLMHPTQIIPETYDLRISEQYDNLKYLRRLKEQFEWLGKGVYETYLPKAYLDFLYMYYPTITFLSRLRDDGTKSSQELWEDLMACGALIGATVTTKRKEILKKA